jgi:hypothetical protein
MPATAAAAARTPTEATALAIGERRAEAASVRMDTVLSSLRAGRLPVRRQHRLWAGKRTLPSSHPQGIRKFAGVEVRLPDHAGQSRTAMYGARRSGGDVGMRDVSTP